MDNALVVCIECFVDFISFVICSVRMIPRLILYLHDQASQMCTNKMCTIIRSFKSLLLFACGDR